MSLALDVDALIGLISSPQIDYQRRGINAFAKALYHFPAVLDSYLKYSPKLVELIRLWENVYRDWTHELHAPLIHLFAVVMLHPQNPIDVQEFASKYWEQLVANLRSEQLHLLVVTFKMLTAINRKKPHFFRHKFNFGLLGKWCEGGHAKKGVATKRMKMEPAQRLHHAFIEFAMSFLEGGIRSAIETMLLLPTFLNLLVQGLRRLAPDIQHWILETLHDKVLTSCFISRNIKVQAFCRITVCTELIACMRPGHPSEAMAEKCVRAVMHLLVQSIKRAPMVVTAREINSRADQKPARLLLQFVSTMLPHRSFAHLNFIMDTFTQLPSLATFYAAVFFNAKWKRDMGIGKILCIVNIISRLLALPIPDAVLTLTNIEEITDVAVPQIYLRTRLTSWAQTENRLLLLQTLQLATVIIDRYHRLITALKARPEGLSLEMESRLGACFQSKVFNPDSVHEWSYRIHRQAKENLELEHFVSSRYLVLIWYYFLHVPSFKVKIPFDLLPFPLKEKRYDGWSQLPDFLQRQSLLLLLKFTPEPTTWTTFAHDPNHPTHIKSLLAYVHDLGPEEPTHKETDIELRHLAAALLVKIFIQLSYTKATEAQELEAYTWVYCFRQAPGKDKNVLQLWRLLMHSTSCLRHDIQRGREIRSDILLLRYARKTSALIYPAPLELLDTVNAQLAMGASSVAAWKQQVARTLLKYADGMKVSKAAPLPPLAPSAEVIDQEPSQTRKRKAQDMDLEEQTQVTKEKEESLFLFVDLFRSFVDEGTGDAAQKLFHRAPLLLGYLYSKEGEENNALIFEGLAARNGMLTFRNAVTEFLLTEEPPANAIPFLKLLLSVATYLYARNATDDGTEDEELNVRKKEFQKTLVPTLLACYTGTLSDQDCILYTLLGMSSGRGDMGAKAIHNNHYFTGRALRNASDFVRPCKSFEDLQVTLFEEVLDSDTLSQTISHHPLGMPWNEWSECDADPSAFQKEITEYCSSKDKPHPMRAFMDVSGVAGDLQWDIKDRSGTGIYDPRYIYPMVYCLLRAAHDSDEATLQSLVNLTQWIKMGLLGYILCGLGMHDSTLRQLAYACLELFYELLWKANQLEHVTMALALLRNGIWEPERQLPTYVLVFVARTIEALLNPLSPNYVSLMIFLSYRGDVSLKELPLGTRLHATFPDEGTAKEVAVEKAWVIRVWAQCLRTPRDLKAFVNASAFQILMNEYYNSNVGRQGECGSAFTTFCTTRLAILEFFKRAFALDAAACEIVKSGTFQPFLCDILSQSSHKLHREISMACELIEISYRWMTRVSSQGKYHWLWEEYSHSTTHGVVLQMLPLLESFDLALIALDCIEACYHCYVATALDDKHTDALDSDHTVVNGEGQRKKPKHEEWSEKRTGKLDTPLISTCVLQQMIDYLRQAPSWSLYSQAITNILRLAAVDHAAFGNQQVIQTMLADVLKLDNANPQEMQEVPVSGSSKAQEVAKESKRARQFPTKYIVDSTRQQSHSDDEDQQETNEPHTCGNRAETNGRQRWKTDATKSVAKKTPKPKQPKLEKVIKKKKSHPIVHEA